MKKFVVFYYDIVERPNAQKNIVKKEVEWQESYSDKISVEDNLSYLATCIFDDGFLCVGEKVINANCILQILPHKTEPAPIGNGKKQYNKKFKKRNKVNIATAKKEDIEQAKDAYDSHMGETESKLKKDNAAHQQRDEGSHSEEDCSPSVESRWDGETLIWVIDGIEILDSDLRTWCMIHMPDQLQKPYDGIIRKYHTAAWWQAWKRGDHLKATAALTGGDSRTVERRCSAEDCP